MHAVIAKIKITMAIAVIAKGAKLSSPGSSGLTGGVSETAFPFKTS